MKGSIVRRGKRSWRIIFDVGPRRRASDSGLITPFRGTRQEVEHATTPTTSTKCRHPQGAWLEWR